jgi:dipeptidyl aminopeptidase/acylaminoacyl peptidase
VRLSRTKGSNWVLGAFAALAVLTSLRAQPLPTETFTRPPAYSEAKLSPDGKCVGFITGGGGKDNRRVLVLLDLATGGVAKLEAPSPVRKMEMRDFLWINDRRLMLMTGIISEDGFLDTLAVDRDGTHLTLLDESYHSGLGRLPNGILQIPGGSSDLVLMQPPRVMETPVVYEVNTLSGHINLVADDSDGMDQWIPDREGHVRLGAHYDWDETRIIYRENDRQPWRRLHEFDLRGVGAMPNAIDYDGRTAYISGLTPYGTWGVFKYDLVDRNKGQLVWADPIYDIFSFRDATSQAAILFSKKRRKMVGIRYTTDLLKTVWFDPEMSQLQAMLDRALPGVANTITGWSDDESKFMVFSWSDRLPGTYYVLDRKIGRLRRIFDLRPWIKPGEMGKTLPISFKARDGLVVHAYLTLPPGTSGKNLPLIVMPPKQLWTRTAIVFTPFVQFLANRGYAVLQVDSRGAPGYGRRFLEEGNGQIGRAVQDDITDGVKWATQAGIANPLRVAIVGEGVGGYSALRGLTQTPSLYRCGVSIRGFSDWLSLLKYTGHQGADAWLTYENWARQVHGINTYEADLREISPFYSVAGIKAPVLVVHPFADETSLLKQSKQFVEELRDQGLRYEELFPVIAGETELYRRVAVFLDKNMQ